jgi:hypothetical protein
MLFAKKPGIEPAALKVRGQKNRGSLLSGLAVAAPLIFTQMGMAQIVPEIRNFDVSDFTTGQVLPARLSQTGLYTNIASKARTLSDTNSIVAFEVNTALWSDASHKERFISIPPGGAKIVPTDTSLFDFPAKTVLIKNFMIDTIVGDPTSRIYIETRFLVFQSKEKDWSGLSYRWRRNQTDADLVDRDWGELIVHGVVQNGVPMGKRGSYPSGGDCKECHSGTDKVKRGTLGFITPQLNRMVNGINQMQQLVAKGVLSANPVAGKLNAHRWYGIDETSATLEQRVRSYFAANCSHCHGNANTFTEAAQSFDYFDPAKKVTTADSPVDGWVGVHTNPEKTPLINPGRPDSSVIITKMMFRADDFRPLTSDQMPPLATAQPDSAAVKMIEQWICSLKSGTTCAIPAWLPDNTFWADASEVSPPASIHAKAVAKGAHFSANFRNGMLVLPFSVNQGEKVSLRDNLGRNIALQPMGNGAYRVLNHLNAGVYFLKAGSYRSTVNYLQ